LPNGAPLALRHAAEADLKPGDPLPVAFPADTISLFDDVTGARL
jgi:hypothetical protein